MDVQIVEMMGRVPVTVFRVAGSINSDTSRQLQARIRQVFEGGARNFLLDLSEVPHVSSAGLRVFADVLNLLRDEPHAAAPRAARRPAASADAFKSPHFKLLNPGEQVVRTLSLTGFNIFLETHTDLDEALASF